MVDWYVVAECEWLGPNFGQSEYLDMSGYTEGTMDSQDIQTHGEVGDPFLSYGIDTETWVFGQAQMEIGLIGSHRIRINSSGVRIWTAGDVWEDPLTAGGGGDLDDLDDVIITTPADNELLAYDNGTSKWINQTPAEAGLDIHSETHVLATTGPHTGTLPWTDLNKTGSNLTDLATRQHAGLTDVTADQHHVAFVQGDADGLYSVLAHLHDDRYYTETEIGNKVFEQSATFPVAPSEGDLHYDTVDEALYRRDGDAQAWIQIGASGGGGDVYPLIGLASDDIVFSNDAERSKTSLTYVKIKEITVYRNLNLRVYWEGRKADVPDTGYERLYINNVAVGGAKSLALGFTAFTEDVHVNNGDLIQIYGKCTAIASGTFYARNMKLKFIEYISTEDY